MGAFSVYFGDGRWQEGRRTVGGVWSVGAKTSSGSRELSAFGLPGQVCCVGQGNWRRVWSVGTSMASGSKELAAGVVCRGEIAEWVKKIVGGVWSVGGCGLSGRKRRVGQENWRRRLVCRDKFVAWVKRPVGGVWSVGVKTASGSRGLSAGVVWRGKFVAWVKGTVARVWSVGAKMLRGSKGLSLECGLSA